MSGKPTKKSPARKTAPPSKPPPKKMVEESSSESSESEATSSTEEESEDEDDSDESNVEDSDLEGGEDEKLKAGMQHMGQNPLLSVSDAEFDKAYDLQAGMLAAKRASGELTGGQFTFAENVLRIEFREMDHLRSLLQKRK